MKEKSEFYQMSHKQSRGRIRRLKQVYKETAEKLKKQESLLKEAKQKIKQYEQKTESFHKSSHEHNRDRIRRLKDAFKETAQKLKDQKEKYRNARDEIRKFKRMEGREANLLGNYGRGPEPAKQETPVYYPAPEPSRKYNTKKETPGDDASEPSIGDCPNKVQPLHILGYYKWNEETQTRTPFFEVRPVAPSPDSSCEFQPFNFTSEIEDDDDNDNNNYDMRDYDEEGEVTVEEDHPFGPYTDTDDGDKESSDYYDDDHSDGEVSNVYDDHSFNGNFGSYDEEETADHGVHTASLRFQKFMESHEDGDNDDEKAVPLSWYLHWAKGREEFRKNNFGKYATMSVPLNWYVRWMQGREEERKLADIELSNDEIDWYLKMMKSREEQRHIDVPLNWYFKYMEGRRHSD